MISAIFHWWLLLFILGLFGLPLTFFLFKKLYDGGYALSKVIFLSFLSYLVWLSASLKILSFSFYSIVFFVLTFFCGNLFLLKRMPDFWRKIKENWLIIFFEEGLFLVGFLAWAYIRSFLPDIHGLEKFMDFGFIQAILRSRFFPPHDMWLSGYQINYYYFGHLETAILTRLSSVAPSIGYNLMLASLCGLMLSISFSITSNLVYWQLKDKKRFWLPVVLGGVISAFLLTFGGNLQPVFYWLKNKTMVGYWYPDATRFIVEKYGAFDNTIHEFPLYSLVVSDLHGHLLDVPHVLLIVGLIFSLWQFLTSFSEEARPFSKIKDYLVRFLTKFLPFLLKRPKKLMGVFQEAKGALVKIFSSLPLCLALGMVLGITFMTNAWDYPIYLLFIGAVVLSFNWLTAGNKREALIQTALFCLLFLLTSFLAMLPFYLSFKNIAQGIASVDFHSPPWMLFFLWGFPFLVSISFFLFLKKGVKKIEEIDFFVLALMIVSWFLILVPEVFRIKDIYAHNHQRANTMFKLTYQSFVVFRLLSGYVFIRLATGLKKSFLKKSFFLLFLAGAVVLLAYPFFAVRSYYNGLKTPYGLDGVKYLEKLYPDDYRAIIWLNQEVKGAPVILEAVGESYSDCARVSAYTGLPAVLGWRVHEWLWRGSFDIPALRTEEVLKIYTSKNMTEVEDLLEKYEVKFVFIGDQERKAYPDLNEKIFASLGEVVFSSGKTKIYQIQ